MFKIGDRVKLVRYEGGSDKWSDVVGTITDKMEGNMATVAWDIGLTGIYNYLQLRKYEKKTEQKKKESEASEYQKHLWAIYENMAFTDFTIICKAGGEEYKFPCHKAIIATGCASGYFARMFGSGMTETSSGEVELQGYYKDEVEHFIKFLYTLEVEEEILEKHSVKFLKMADQYDVPKLKADVTNFLRSKLTMNTVLSTVLAAHSYNAPELKTAAIAFIVKMKNKVEEKGLAEWKHALKGHEDLLFDIFSAVYKK